MSIEVRNNDDGTLDEIVGHGADVHLEQMDNGCWWLSISEGSRVVHVYLLSRSVIKANLMEDVTTGAREDHEDNCKLWDGGECTCKFRSEWLGHKDALPRDPGEGRSHV